MLLLKKLARLLLSSNDDQRMQSIDSIETCIWNEQRCSMSKKKRSNPAIEEHHPNWPEICNHTEY